MNAFSEINRIDNLTSYWHWWEQDWISDVEFKQNIEVTLFNSSSIKVRYLPLYVKGRRVTIHKKSYMEFYASVMSGWYQPYRSRRSRKHGN